MAKEYYDILGLQKGASIDEIKKAYRALSKELHPDKHKGDKAAEARFKEVNEAYEVLSNPQKKQMYDQFGSAGMNGGASGFAGQEGFNAGGFDFSGFAGGADGMNFSDLFEGFFGGGSAGARRRSGKGEDKEVSFEIEFAEAVSGARHVLRVRKLRACDRCSGSGAEAGSKLVTCTECGGTGQVTRTTQSFFGAMQQRILCPRCGGSGKVPEKACSKCTGEGRVAESAEIPVDVPAGIDDGQTLRLRGEGDAGRQGEPAGDLYVHIRVRPDSRFQREGADVRSALLLPVLDAMLGATVHVETVHGPVSVKVDAGTQPGHVLRLKGKGMPVLNTSRHGDHYVAIDIGIPTKLSREERKILEEWKKVRE